MFGFLRQIVKPSLRSCLPLVRNAEASFCTRVPKAIIRQKKKSKESHSAPFVDLKTVRTLGGRGGDGSISFLQLWVNDKAGPDGGDGGNGGHVVFQASRNVKSLVKVQPVLQAEHGEDGRGKDMHGKNGSHMVVGVPVGTVVRNAKGKIVGDLDEDGSLFIAARGGAGGKGNHFFSSNDEQTPQICEYGAIGENLNYTVELKSMAHLGLIGLPNAGKSTLLNAITRARPKVAPYAFTTLHPHIGTVHYDDYEQVSIADLPGLIEGSHQNKGLGIQFLKHAERCSVLMYIIDLSCMEPWEHYESLRFELGMFSKELVNRPQVIVGNKMDVPEASINLQSMKEIYPDIPIIPISAKMGTNLEELLRQIRILYDKYNVPADE